MPLRHPGIFLTILLGPLLAACSDTGSATNDGKSLCQTDSMSVTAIQGDGYHSPHRGKQLITGGVVTRVFTGTGFYMEDSGVDQPANSSRALFVSDAALSRSVDVGQRIAINGQVGEHGDGRDKLTSIVSVTGHEICGNALQLPITQVSLPMNSAQREALEGMRVRFEQPLSVTDVYNLHRGELTLSAEGWLKVPTEFTDPGAAASAASAENRERSITVRLPGGIPAATPVGTLTSHVDGLMGHDGKSQMLFIDAPIDGAVPPEDELEPAADGHVRIVSLNLLNFFNGDGKGGGFPNVRGAETLGEFQAQKERTRAAITKMQPQLLAVQELENDGFEDLGAAQALLDLLNETGHDDWAFVDPGSGPIGSDVITVGLFYRTGVWEETGPPLVLDGPAFEMLSRRPLAQSFRHLASGDTVLVAVNHLKSKGRCPETGDNADRADGQGCWNVARLAAVHAQLPWLEELAAARSNGKALVLGDMNAWRREDPIRAWVEWGYTGLVEELSGLPQHSFLYWGQSGTLDYAFASGALLDHARSAVIWHINAHWPGKMKLPQPWLRASDHDPVVIDLAFSQSTTSD